MPDSPDAPLEKQAQDEQNHALQTCMLIWGKEGVRREVDPARRADEVGWCWMIFE